jgi:outer membrane protein insertion porin family
LVELGTVDVIQHFTSDDEGQPLKGPYRKLQLDLRHYWSGQGRKIAPTDKRTVVALRIEGGVGGGDMPFFEQFFVGGAETLRGYQEDRFWGRNMLLASVEYRKPISQGLTGVIFADCGDAWGAPPSYSSEQFPQHEDFSPRLGVGIGLRVNTPIGNLRLDYGMGSEGARTHFSIGQAF